MKKRFLLLLALPLLLAGCISTQVDYCLGGVCSNASVNVTASLPALPSPSPLPEPSPRPAPLLEAVSGADSVDLGDSFSFTVDYSFGAPELGYADLRVYADGVEFASLEPVNDGKPVALHYSVVGSKVGEHFYSVNVSSFYANGSLYRTQSTGFRVTVKPLGYYRNEALNHSVNASSKAAQSFTLANPAEITRLSVFGVKKADAALQFELCVDWDGQPGTPLSTSYYDVTGVPSLPAWYSIDLNVTLEPGKYWILVNTQGSFDWFSDLYGEDEFSDSVYRYEGSWIPGSRDKFYRVTN